MPPAPPQALPGAAPVRSRQDYPIGVICALAIEKAAFVAMLDAVHEPLPTPRGDDNSYTLGCAGAHNVVVACLPAGTMGNNPAATAAKDMRRSFPGIRFGLLVGIGGGVWFPGGPDVRLGDVVVSQPDGAHGGVVQWDFGKMEGGGQFRRTGSLDRPPPVLLQALNAVKIRHETEVDVGESLMRHLSTMAQRNPLMQQEYAQHPNEPDRLFEAGYDHPRGDTCEACDQARIVRRPPRMNRATPRVHYGNIASGNEVMKHGITRDRIARSEQVICFEMEAAGLMNSFPCLVIRGICDYADSHKNKRWQRYAAATAAAFARELLEVVETQRIDEPDPESKHRSILFFCTRVLLSLSPGVSAPERDNSRGFGGRGGLFQSVPLCLCERIKY